MPPVVGPFLQAQRGLEQPKRLSSNGYRAEVFFDRGDAGPSQRNPERKLIVGQDAQQIEGLTAIRALFVLSPCSLGTENLDYLSTPGTRNLLGAQGRRRRFDGSVGTVEIKRPTKRLF